MGKCIGEVAEIITCCLCLLHSVLSPTRATKAEDLILPLTSLELKGRDLHAWFLLWPMEPCSQQPPSAFLGKWGHLCWITQPGVDVWQYSPRASCAEKITLKSWCCSWVQCLLMGHFCSCLVSALKCLEPLAQTPAHELVISNLEEFPGRLTKIWGSKSACAQK